MDDKISENQPIVSVCCITYNHENFIRDTINGFLMQKTTFPFEIIIGEDFSKDNTRNICIEYLNKHPNIFRLLLSDRNLGMSSNFVRTLKSCRGKYIALCEGDDYWTDPFKLQKQVDFLELNPDYSICFHNVKILKNNELINDCITRSVRETTSTVDLIDGNYIHTTSCVFKNNFKEGKIPDILYKSPLGDYALHIFNSQYGKIKKIEESMAVYRVHNESIFSSRNTMENTISVLKTIDCLLEFFSKDDFYRIKLMEKKIKYLRNFDRIVFDSFLYFPPEIKHEKNILELKNISISQRNKPVNICFDIENNEICSSAGKYSWVPMEKPVIIKLHSISYKDSHQNFYSYDLNKISTNGSIQNRNPLLLYFYTQNPKIILKFKAKIFSINIDCEIFPMESNYFRDSFYYNFMMKYFKIKDSVFSIIKHKNNV